MLKGKLNIPFGLAKLHPQLTAQDLLDLQRLRESKEYGDWSELFKDFLTEKGIEIPKEQNQEDTEIV